MLILFGELDRDLLAAKVEGVALVEEGARGVIVVCVFDEGEALDGAMVLAWLCVFGDIDVVQCAEGREHLLHLGDGDVARKVAYKERLDVARIYRDRRRLGQSGFSRRNFLHIHIHVPTNTQSGACMLLIRKLKNVVDDSSARAVKNRVLKSGLVLFRESLVPRELSLMHRAQNGVGIDVVLKTENHCKGPTNFLLVLG